MFGISRENPDKVKGTWPEEVKAQNIDLDDATINASVEVARSAVFAEKLRTAIESHLKHYTPLPQGFSLVFHNTEPQFDWGGWLPPARPVKTTTAVLQFDLGQGAVEKVVSQKEITKRLGWGPTGENLSVFVERAYKEAHGELDNVRYMRHLSPEKITRKLCDRISELLRENGIADRSPNAIQHPRCGSAYGVVPVLHVEEKMVSEVSTLLTQIHCVEVGTLPSPAERFGNMPTSSAVGGRVLLYDATPILVFPDSDISCFRKTEPTTYRTPDLVNFYPDDKLREALKDCLRGDFDVSRERKQNFIGSV